MNNGAHICSSRTCKNDCGGTCEKHEDTSRDRPYYGHHDDPEAIRVSISDIRSMIHGSKKS